MRSKEYLKNSLNKISNFFPELTFKYQFNENTGTHIVEVKPLEDYKTNDDYIKQESDLMFNFENEFFPETILFVSENSLTQVTEPEYVIRKQEFVISALISNYTFEFNEEELFSMLNDGEYALAA